MPKYHSGYCLYCGKYFERGQGIHFCSNPCCYNWKREFSGFTPNGIYELEFAKKIKAIPDFSEKLTLPYRDFAAIGDLHLPLLNIEYFVKFLTIVKKFGIQFLAIGGDLLDGDSFSKFGQEYAKWFNFDDETNSATEIVKFLFQWFQLVAWTMGNHDFRFLRQCEGNVSFQKLVEMIYLRNDKFLTHNHQAMQIGDWTLTHPDKGMAIKGSKARLLESNVYRTHTVNFHEHTNSIQRNAPNTNWLISVGMMADLTKIKYAHSKENHMNRMENGFLIVQDNHPYLFFEQVDWGYWLDKPEIHAAQEVKEEMQEKIGSFAHQ